MANGALFYAWATIIMFSILVQPQHKGARMNESVPPHRYFFAMRYSCPVIHLKS